MRDAYRGQRCFIIGNGPSLNQMDLSHLKNEITFGLNRANLFFDRIGGPTTFLVAVNRNVVEQFGEEIAAQESVRLMPWHLRFAPGTRAGVLYFNTRTLAEFSPDPTRKGVWEGSTVTFVAMQLAYYLGFSMVVLIGVDHRFSASGPPDKLVTAREDDRDHFDPRYFGPGVRWQLPDLATSEHAYGAAKSAFEACGRQILDATVGGALTTFPKVEYRDVLGLNDEAEAT